MINIVCSKCNLALRTSGEHDEVDHLVGPKSSWYPNSYPCPGCGSDAEYVESISALALRVVDVRDLTVQELFAALNGLGLPEEQECGPLAVQQALSLPVTSIDCEMIKGTGRSVLRSIEFEGGTTMYLGSSPYGATVYRIAKKRSYTQEALNAS